MARRATIIHSTEEDNIDLLAPVRDILRPGQLKGAMEKTAEFVTHIAEESIKQELPKTWNHSAQWRSNSPLEPIYKGVKDWIADKASQARVYVDYSSMAVLFAHPTQFRHTKKGYRRGRMTFSFWSKVLQHTQEIQRELKKNITNKVNELLENV